MGQFAAAHLGHDDVGEQNVDGAIRLIPPAKSRSPGFRDQDGIAEPLENGVGEQAHGDFIFHEEHGLAAGRRTGRAKPRGDFRCRGCLGKVEAEGGAFPDRTFNVDPAFALRNHAVDGRKAQAGSLPRLFGRIEGIENARADGLFHADAVVADRQQYRQRLPLFLGDRVRQTAAANQELATERHGVPRVDGEIHNGLLHLVRIGVDQAIVRSAFDIDFDVFADDALKQPVHARQEVGEVQNFGLDRLAPAESE